MGLTYIKNWSPILIPILTFLCGFISIFGLIYFGEIIIFHLKLEIHKYWQIIVNLFLGIFSFSLLIQLISFMSLNNKFSLSILFTLLLFLSLKKIFKTNFYPPKINRNEFIPVVLLISILFIRILISTIPTTKIDELHYHMLLPLRIISEPGLNYYSLPWEAAIWPHMHYQFIGAPFYAIGLPDSLNIISIGIFVIFLKTVFDLIKHHVNNNELILWCLVLISTGLHSLVDLTTNASNSLLLVSGSFTLLILCDPEKYLPTKNLKSFSLVFGLFSLGLVGSKISMMPIFLIQILIFLRTIKITWGFKAIKKSLFYLLIPFLTYYLPIVLYTWIKSGSPFGPLLSSLLIEKVNIDPLIRATKGEIGNQGGFLYFAFLAITKWSPIIWISCFFIAYKKIKLKTKIIFFLILTIQSLLICNVLPDLPRHFGGFQYVAILIVFIEIIPQIFQKFKSLFLSIFLFSSIPWLLLDIYYSYPLLSKAFFKSEQFKRDYIPFYEDFLILDNLLEKDSQILVIGNRINSFHSPRKIFLNERNVLLPNNDINDKEKTTYLFLVGEKNEKTLDSGQLIYSNDESNKRCFRIPNKSCEKAKLKVYKIDNSKISPKDLFIDDP